MQKDHFFCIIDEADSILIDEARTPLIISGPMREDNPLPFNEMKPLVTKLVDAQVRQCNVAGVWNAIVARCKQLNYRRCNLGR